MQTENQAGNPYGNHTESREERLPLEVLQVREYIAVFLWLAGLIAFALFWKVPLGMSPKGEFLAQVKAPWIFGGIQELLLFLPTDFAGIVFPLISLVFLLTLPWWGRVLKLRWVNLSVFLLLGIWIFLMGVYVWRVS